MWSDLGMWSTSRDGLPTMCWSDSSLDVLLVMARTLSVTMVDDGDDCSAWELNPGLCCCRRRWW